MKKRIYALIASILLIMFDQLTKYLAVTHLKGSTDIRVVGNIITLHYLENTGAAFGILTNKRIFFILLTLVFFFIFLFLYFKIPLNPRYTPLRVLTIFIFSGAFGNFIDRLLNGFVIDFIYLKIINFPVFNIADMYITFSCVLVVVLFLFVYNDEDWDKIFSPKKKKN